MTHDLNRIGGWAAILLAASYIFGFAVFLGFIDRTGYEGPAGNLAFIADHQTILTAAMIILYPLAGAALVALVVALHNYAAKSAAGMLQIATVFGLLWAGVVIASGLIFLSGLQTIIPLAADHPETAASAWVAVAVVQDALGGGSEFLGGIWALMVSWLCLKAGLFSKTLGAFGIALGIVGIITIIPDLSGLVDIFGLGQIVWFLWLGTVLLRTEPAAETAGNLVDS